MNDSSGEWNTNDKISIQTIETGILPLRCASSNDYKWVFLCFAKGQFTGLCGANDLM